MTKAHLVEAIILQCDISKVEAQKLIEQFLELIKSTLEQGEKVMISGVGSFAVREKTARKGRNPQTGVEIILAGRKVVTFHPSKVLVEKMNEASAT